MVKKRLLMGDLVGSALELKNSIGDVSSIELIASVGDLHQLITQVGELLPEALLINVELPGVRLLNSIRILTEILPNIGYLYIVLKPKEKAYYLPKGIDSDGVKAVFDADHEQMYPELSAKILEEFNRMSAGQVSVPVQYGEKSTLPLTKRELEVVAYMAKGFGDKKIADILVISEKTVRNHIRNVRQKLRVKTRTQVVLYAVQAGLVDISEIALDTL